jgi:predicted MFS family arabinose efflux permease
VPATQDLASDGGSLSSMEMRSLLVFGALAAAMYSVPPAIALTLSIHAGFSAASFGLLLTLSSIGAMATGMASSALCLRYGRRLVMQSAVWLFCTAWVVALAYPSSWSLCLAVALGGVTAPVFGILFSFIGTGVDKSHRARAYAWMLAAMGVGYTVGPLLAPTVQRLSSFEFFCCAMACAASLHAWSAAKVPDSRPQRTTTTPERRLAWLVPQAALPAFAVLLVMKAGNIVAGSYGPLHAQKLYSSQAWTTSLVYSLLGASMVVAPLLLHLLKRFMSENAIPVVAFVGMAAGLLFCGLASSPVTFLVAFALWALSWDLAYPYANAALSQAATESEQVGLAGTVQWTSSAANLVVTPAAGVAVAHSGSPSVFLFAGLGTVAVLIAANRIRRKQEQQTPAC